MPRGQYPRKPRGKTIEERFPPVQLSPAAAEMHEVQAESGIHALVIPTDFDGVQVGGDSFNATEVFQRELVRLTQAEIEGADARGLPRGLYHPDSKLVPAKTQSEVDAVVAKLNAETPWVDIELPPAPEILKNAENYAVDFTPARACSRCVAFEAGTQRVEDGILGECKMLPRAEPKRSSDWCLQFKAREA